MMEYIFGNEKLFDKFISNLSKEDNIALFSHNDSDGICSAILLSKVLPKLKIIRFLDYKPNLFKSLIEELHSSNITKLIILDLSVEREISVIQELSTSLQILILDHHEMISDINSKNISLIKTKSDFPTSYIAYTLCSKIKEVPVWIGVLGSLSDLCYKYSEKNSSQIFYDLHFPGEPKNYFKETILLSNSLIFFENSSQKIFDKLKDMNDISELSYFKKYSSSIDEEIEKFSLLFKSKSEKKGDLLFYFFEPKYTITSLLINRLSMQDIHKTFVFVTKFNNSIRISCRRQDGEKDCILLLKSAMEGIPNSTFGGHKSAAGGHISSEYFIQFKKNLFALQYD